MQNGKILEAVEEAEEASAQYKEVIDQNKPSSEKIKKVVENLDKFVQKWCLSTVGGGAL